jgi:hypothetical protein
VAARHLPLLVVPGGEAAVIADTVSGGLVFVDLDSTLSNSLQRHHLIDEDWDKTDWQAYALASRDDEVFVGVAQVVRMLFQAGHAIVIVSGRDVAARDITLAWLKANEIPYDGISMRPVGDVRPNEELKVALMTEHLQRWGREAPTLVLDDWPPLVAEMEKLGWPLLLVNPNYPVPASVLTALAELRANDFDRSYVDQRLDVIERYLRRYE